MNKQRLFYSAAILAVVSMALFAFKHNEKTYIKTELYFGQSRNDIGNVTPEEWQAFEDTVIAVSFPNGSTLFEANGKWMNENGIAISERSKMLVLINELTPELSAQIDSVREKYKRYHHQTAVLRVDQKVDISF